MSKKRYARGSALLLVAALTVAATSLPAFALSSAPDVTWSVKGKVYSFAQYGDTLFVGGTLTKAISPTGKRTLISNLAAFSISTGNFLPGFTPTVTSTAGKIKVTALAVSTDGSKLYVGGLFDTVDGQPRRNFAAIDLATGTQVDPSVDPGPNRKVSAILAGPQLVYFGGQFIRTADHQDRLHIAAISATTGALSSTWSASATAGKDPCPSQFPNGTSCGPVSDGGMGSVHSLALSSDGSGLFIGGNFYYMNGTPRNTLAEVSAADGSLLPWRVPWRTIPSEGQGAPYTGPNVLRTIVTTPTRVFVGWGRTPNGFEAYSTTMTTSSGECATGCATQLWMNQTPGNPESMAMSPDGTRLFVGGHFGTGNLDFQVTSCGSNVWAHGLISVNPTNGAYYCDWIPQLHPFGGTNAPGSGQDPANFQGATSMQMTSSGLWVGGKITSISGVPQQGIARFHL
jgi:hypothetical protein